MTSWLARGVPFLGALGLQWDVPPTGDSQLWSYVIAVSTEPLLGPALPPFLVVSLIDCCMYSCECVYQNILFWFLFCEWNHNVYMFQQHAFVHLAIFLWDSFISIPIHLVCSFNQFMAKTHLFVAHEMNIPYFIYIIYIMHVYINIYQHYAFSFFFYITNDYFIEFPWVQWSNISCWLLSSSQLTSLP